MTGFRKGCVESIVLEDWQAEQSSNPLACVVNVAQLGRQDMQFSFGGHPHLFLNPEATGNIFPILFHVALDLSTSPRPHVIHSTQFVAVDSNRDFFGFALR